MNARQRAAVAALSIVSLAGCAPWRRPIGIELRRQTRFESEWTGYLELPPHKALAVAGDLGGVYASGLAYSCASVEEAVATALERCEERRADRRISDGCRAYANGDERMSASTSSGGSQ